MSLLEFEMPIRHPTGKSSGQEHIGVQSTGWDENPRVMGIQMAFIIFL